MYPKIKKLACTLPLVAALGLGLSACGTGDNNVTEKDMRAWSAKWESNKQVEWLDQVVSSTDPEAESFGPGFCDAALNAIEDVQDKAPKPPYAEKEYDNMLSNMHEAFDAQCNNVSEDPLANLDKLGELTDSIKTFETKVEKKFPGLKGDDLGL